MFQSIENLGYKYILDVYEYKLHDSDFDVLLQLDLSQRPNGGHFDMVVGEYTKRKLNVAANLIRYFKWYEKLWDVPIAKQLHWERRNSLLTTELKADIQKYLALL